MMGSTLFGAMLILSFAITPLSQLEARGHFAGAAGAVSQKPLQESLAPECSAQLHELNSKEKRKKAAECEQENGYSDQVIEHLQGGQEAEAVAVTAKSFESCGKLSFTCAGEVAPSVVQEIRFSGVAVSDTCRERAAKTQKDEKFMAQVHKCESDEKVAEQLLSALNEGNLRNAVESSEHGLEKCMKLSDVCAFQIAPVLVNQVVTMAMMQQSGMMPVFAAKNLEAAEKKNPLDASLSLLAIAMASRKPRPPVLLQSRRSSLRHVSRLILELALK